MKWNERTVLFTNFWLRKLELLEVVWSFCKPKSARFKLEPHQMISSLYLKQIFNFHLKMAIFFRSFCCELKRESFTALDLLSPEWLAVDRPKPTLAPDTRACPFLWCSQGVPQQIWDEVQLANSCPPWVHLRRWAAATCHHFPDQHRCTLSS